MTSDDVISGEDYLIRLPMKQLRLLARQAGIDETLTRDQLIETLQDQEGVPLEEPPVPQEEVSPLEEEVMSAVAKLSEEKTNLKEYFVQVGTAGPRIVEAESSGLALDKFKTECGILGYTSKIKPVCKPITDDLRAEAEKALLVAKGQMPSIQRRHKDLVDEEMVSV